MARDTTSLHVRDAIGTKHTVEKVPPRMECQMPPLLFDYRNPGVTQRPPQMFLYGALAHRDAIRGGLMGPCEALVDRSERFLRYAGPTFGDFSSMARPATDPEPIREADLARAQHGCACLRPLSAGKTRR